MTNSPFSKFRATLVSLVAGLVGHGLKDLWQHCTHFVANTRWWPPFCMVVDFVVAAIAGSFLVSYTRAKAEALGLTRTRYRNPHGLDEAGHVSTAADSAALRLGTLEEILELCERTLPAREK